MDRVEDAAEQLPDLILRQCLRQPLLPWRGDPFFPRTHQFVDFTGTYVLHCDILAHEDRSMIQLVGVVHASKYPGCCQTNIPVHHLEMVRVMSEKSNIENLCPT